MSKREYEAIAEVLRTAGLGEGASGAGAVRRVAERLATVFEADNPRFDRERFLRAAGGEIR